MNRGMHFKRTELDPHAVAHQIVPERTGNSINRAFVRSHPSFRSLTTPPFLRDVPAPSPADTPAPVDAPTEEPIAPVAPAPTPDPVDDGKQIILVPSLSMSAFFSIWFGTYFAHGFLWYWD